MKQLFTILFILCLPIYLSAQINKNDSTVQVIGYWAVGETQSYNVTQEKYKIKEGDTLRTEFYKYVVDVTIVDSTADAYLIDWAYRDYEVEAINPLIEKIASIAEDLTVTIRTNELGTIQEVVNWKEVRDEINRGMKVMEQEAKEIPNFGKVMKQIKKMYSSKESIELRAIKDIRQYYSFHGGKYKLEKEYNAELKVPNLFGGEPFNNKMSVWLHSIYPDNNSFVLKMQQVIDPEQLTDATFDYLTQIAKTMKTKAPMPKKEDMPPLGNTTWTTSEYHGSGWLLYSLETKIVEADNVRTIEEREIDLQMKQKEEK